MFAPVDTLYCTRLREHWCASRRHSVSIDSQSVCPPVIFRWTCSQNKTLVAAEHTAEQVSETDGEEDFFSLATASRQVSIRTKAACKDLATHLLMVRIPAQRNVSPFNFISSPRQRQKTSVDTTCFVAIDESIGLTITKVRLIGCRESSVLLVFMYPCDHDRGGDGRSY